MAESHDTEVWKPVVGYEGFYEVSNLGRVRSLDRYVSLRNRWGDIRERRYKGKLLVPFLHKGYPHVAVRKGSAGLVQQSVHRMVLEAFVGECPPRMEACHNDGNRRNAALSNLRWDTRANNHADKIKHGTHLRGTANPQSKFTERDIEVVFDLRRRGLTHAAIAAKIGMSSTHVSNVLNGKRWGHYSSTR